MHGVQPKANAAPATGAAHAPTGGASRGTAGPGRPARTAATMTTAMTTTATPAIRVIGTCWRSSSEPTAVADSPKQDEHDREPGHEQRPGPHRPPLAGAGRDPAPAVSDRYAGTSGSTHGDRNEMTPPPKASTNPVGDTAGPTGRPAGRSGR